METIKSLLDAAKEAKGVETPYAVGVFLGRSADSIFGVQPCPICACIATSNRGFEGFGTMAASENCMHDVKP